jgi:anti-sigma-K factor RskA
MKPLDTLSADERDALAGEYVLGTLPAPLREAVQARLATDVDLALAVAAWERRLQPLAALAEPVVPPARLWQRIETSLDLAPRPPWWRLGWNSLALWRGLAVSGMAAAALMAAVLVNQPPADGPRFLVVLVAPQDKAPGWVVQASDTRSVSLIPLATMEVPADKALEFWTKADGWNAPVSLGLVKPGQRIQVPLDKLPALQPNQLFELTLEPATGSPTGRPTGPIQFIGRAVPVT